MKNKKIIAMLLCAMASVSVFTGCGGSDSDGETGKDSESIVTLDWYTIGQEPKDLETVEAAINEYAGEKIGVNVDMKFIDWNDYTQKMGVIMNTGGEWDMAFTCSWAGDYLGNARKGAFLELDPYLNDQGAEMYEAIDKRFWNGAKIEGKTYAVPTQKEIGVMPSWVFDKSLVEKYDIPYEDLHDIRSLEPWLKIIKENEPDYVPFYIPNGVSFVEDYDPIVEGIGIRLDDEDLKVVNIFEEEEVAERLHVVKKYYDAGYINADSNIAVDDPKELKFVTKADGQPFADRIWSESAGREVVSSSIVDTWITNLSTTGAMVGVSKSTEHPEKAVEFLNLLNTDEYLRNLANYGVEGTHYNLDDKGQVVTVEPKQYDVSYITMGNLFETKNLAGDPEDKWDVFKSENDKAKAAPSLGFKLDTSPIQNELAAISNIMLEYKGIIYGGGASDLDKTLEEFNGRLHEQGMERVIAEMQKQVDAWKVSK